MSHGAEEAGPIIKRSEILKYIRLFLFMGRISGNEIRRVHYIVLKGKSQYISININRFAMYGINYFNRWWDLATAKADSRSKDRPSGHPPVRENDERISAAGPS